MALPFASYRDYDNLEELQLYFPLLTTSPAFPQAGDSYLADVALQNVSVKSIYMERGDMEPDLGWDGSKRNWAEDITEIQTDFVDSGGNNASESFNLLKNTALSTKSDTYWVTVYEKPFVANSTDKEQSYNWIYSDKAPSDFSKIWVNTSSRGGVEPLFYAEGEWKSYYDYQQISSGSKVAIKDNGGAGNSFVVQKPTNVNLSIGISQLAKLDYAIWNGDAITVGFDLKETSTSGGALLRIEFYDINMQLVGTKFSPRYFNKTENRKRFSSTFTYTNTTKASSYIRVTVFGVNDRKVDIDFNKIKAEYGNLDTGWNLNEEEVLLNLNAGETEMPMLDGEIDKSKLISEIAILRSTLNEGLLKWEEVTRLKSSTVQDAVLHDYFVENGNYYRYALQPILANGVKGAITSFFDTVTTFEGFWLLGENDEQFSFIYNGKISEIDNVQPVDLVETISGRFPYPNRTSDVNYKTFNFSGTLTYHQDVHKIFTSDDYSVALSPDPTIPIHYAEIKYGDEKLLNKKNDLEMGQDGMVMQRIWRKKILQWLTNLEPKILKSEAQGNMLVFIDQVKETPNETTFGLISDFTCRVTQIGTLNEKALQKYKLRKESITKDELVKEAMKEDDIL